MRTIYLFIFLLLFGLNVSAQRDSLKLKQQKKINGYISLNYGNSYFMIKNLWYLVPWYSVKNNFRYAVSFSHRLLFNRLNVLFENSLSISTATYNIHNADPYPSYLPPGGIPGYYPKTDSVEEDGSLDFSGGLYKIFFKKRRIRLAPGIGYFFLLNNYVILNGPRVLLFSNIFFDKKRNWAINLCIEKRFYKYPLSVNYSDYKLVYPVNLFIGIQRKFF